jgi:hypothetical protein
MTDPYARRRLVAGILVLTLFLISLIGEAMRDRAVRLYLGVVLSCVVGLVVLLWLLVSAVHARDLGQWGNQDPAIREWFEHLKQPDNTSVSCCGVADGYWCDDYFVKDSHTFCKITDDRPDEPLKRKHVPLGTVIFIPDNKIKFGPNDPQRESASNPTGHTIVFLAVSQYLGADGETDESKNGYGVYCFILDGGV